MKQRAGFPLPDQELLLRAALIRDERAVDAWHALRPKLDLAKLDLARLDGNVIPLIPRLRANLLALGVTDDLMPIFKGVHRHIWARNQLLVTAMAPRLAALERRGIATLLLKGAAILAGRQHDGGFRPVGDVDVLVPTELRRPAIDVLLELGLRPDLGRPAWYVDELVPRFNPSYPFVDADAWQLDLHWHLLHSSRQEDADVDFWDSAKPAVFAGVPTRTLCVTDSLLHALLHGLADNLEPGIRWVFDATLILDGDAPIDWDRLVTQARRRRVSHIVGEGLRYLRHLLDAPVARTVLADLSRGWPRPLQRLEQRAKHSAPRQWGLTARTVVYYQQYARARLPLGSRAGPRMQLRLARECFGIERIADLPALRTGGTPGAYRPAARNEASLGGHGEGVLVNLGEPLPLTDPEQIRSLVGYGAWMPDAGGVWLAGREARLELELGAPAVGSLLVAVSGEHYLAERLGRARMIVCLDGRALGELQVDREAPSLSGAQIRLPAQLVSGRKRLSLQLCMPDATAPSSLGLSDDDRLLGFFVRELVLREPLAYESESTLSFVAGGEGALTVLAGWSVEERVGRWTSGREAGLLIRPSLGGDLELCLDAETFAPAPGGRQRVEVIAGGARVASLTLAAGDRPPPLQIPRTAIDGAGELHVLLRLPDASSPYAAGLSEDRRELGLLLRGLMLSSAPAMASARALAE